MKKMLFLILFLCCFPLLTKADTYGYITTPSNPDVVNIHSEANYNTSNTVAQIYYGTRVKILEENVGSNKMTKILYDGVNSGYIASSYVTKVIDYGEVNPEYCNSLKAAGFDESYCPYLNYLHNLHPNWIFTANHVDKDFTAIIDGEEAKNYIQIASSYNADYFLNKYISKTTPSEGKNWYTATNGVNAFFLDPRNFLSEDTIFMFEELGCGENSLWRNNKEKAIETMYNIFGSSSYLNTTSDTTTPGQIYDYKELFYNAGLSYNVSPVHLAARVKQEGGASSDYVAITGLYDPLYNNKNLKGYYNYYNIGAFVGSNSNEPNPVLNGLVYAMGSSEKYFRPWDTRKKAIEGGAKYIAGSYIGIGQSTLYLQKFDLKNYTHQYMTNVSAPLSEAKSAYNSYKKAGLINGTVEGITKETEPALNFSIPVFNNMGYVRDMPSVLDSSNYLNAILVDGVPINNYDEDIVEYNKYVINTTTKVNIGYTKGNKATVTGDGDVNLVNDTTTVIIKVVAENGAERDYKINIIKVSDTKTINEIMNNVGVKVSNNIIGEIKMNTAISTIISSINSVSPSASVKVTNSNGELISNTGLKTGDKVSVTNLLNETVTYQVAVIGDVSGDGEITLLDLLKVQKHILGNSNLNECYLMAGDTNNDNEITILDLLRIQKHILGTINLG